jgi:hypothetical protein
MSMITFCLISQTVCVCGQHHVHDGIIDDDVATQYRNVIYLEDGFQIVWKTRNILDGTAVSKDGFSHRLVPHSATL